MYLAFSIADVGTMMVAGNNLDALSAGFVAFVITLLLNVLCIRGFTVLAWVIVLVPFALMTLIGLMLLVAGGPFAPVVNTSHKGFKAPSDED